MTRQVPRLRFASLAGIFLIAGSALAELPDLETLDECSERAWNRDVEAWSSFSFDRHVVLRDLGHDGEVTSRTERHFRLTPSGRGFDERLLRENGRAPTREEIEEFRRKSTFTRNYRGAQRLEFDNPLGENLVLMQILQDQDYRLVGEREIDGLPCYLSVFDARPDPRRASAEERLQHATRGSVCVSVDGCHVVELDLETIRPVRRGLATIDHMRVTIRGRPLEDGQWVAQSVDAEFDFVVLGRHVRRFTTYRYSNYRRHQ